MSNATYTDYPFTVNGVNFISRIYSHSEFVKTVEQLPAGVFIHMNQMAVEELMGDPSLLTKGEILSELERLNDGGTHAFILLGANA